MICAWPQDMAAIWNQAIADEYLAQVEALFGMICLLARRHINLELFGLVALGTTPGLSQDKPSLSWDEPRFSPCFAKRKRSLCLGQAICPWDRPGSNKLFFYGGSFFTCSWSFFCLQLSFFAYSPLRPLLDALSHCKQKAPTVSKKAKTVSKNAPTVSGKAKIVSCKQGSSTASRKLPTVRKKPHPFFSR